MRSPNVPQYQVTEYVRVAKNYPLYDGQLIHMVILHFDMPDAMAKEMVEKALEELK